MDLVGITSTGRIVFPEDVLGCGFVEFLHLIVVSCIVGCARLITKPVILSLSCGVGAMVKGWTKSVSIDVK